MEIIVDTHIPIAPVAKERHRVNMKTRRTYTPSGTRNFESAVAQYMGYKVKNPNTEDDLVVWVTFHTDNDRIDLDNCLKSLFDGCNKVVWKDDRQVVESHVYLRRGAKITGIDFKVAIAEELN